MFQCKPLKCSPFTSICISGWEANILNQTTDLRSLASVHHCQTQLSLRVNRPDIWHEVKQIVSLFLRLETRHTDGKNWWKVWLCLVWRIHPSEKEPSTSSAWMMPENLGSCVYLNSLPIWIWLEFRYINQISLLWLPLSHINLHLIKSMKLGRTKKRLSILKPAVDFGLWKCQWKLCV